MCDFARIAGPINQLLRKDTPFLWGEEQETAFERLKEALITAPVLQSFDESRPVIIHTDASLYGIGAILLQKGPDDKEHVVSYISRSLTDAEKQWATTEHEALAIIYAIEKFRPIQPDDVKLGVLALSDDHKSPEMSKKLANYNPETKKRKQSLQTADPFTRCQQ